jgi:hypothetical protein
MTLHDTIKADAETVFCNVNDFAEVVIYYPRDGEARDIDAVVVRQALSLPSEYSDSITPVFEVHVANQSARGITSEELNLGGDSLWFAVRVGEEPSMRSITQLLDHDEGMLVLECR